MPKVKTSKKSSHFKKNQKLARGWKKNVKSDLEITYDEGAKLEYLTGFQKRNQEKRAKAKEYAKSLEKQERLEIRKQKQEALKEKKSIISQDIDRIESIIALGKKQGQAQQSEMHRGEKKVTVTITEYNPDDDF